MVRTAGMKMGKFASQTLGFSDPLKTDGNDAYAITPLAPWLIQPWNQHTASLQPYQPPLPPTYKHSEHQMFSYKISAFNQPPSLLCW